MLKINERFLGEVLNGIKDETEKIKIAEEVLSSPEAKSRDFAVLVVLGPEIYRGRAWGKVIEKYIEDPDDLRYIIGFAPREYKEYAARCIFNAMFESWHYCYIAVNLDGEWQDKAWHYAKSYGIETPNLIYLIEFADAKMAKIAWQELASRDAKDMDIFNAFRYAKDLGLKREIGKYIFSNFPGDWIAMEYIVSYHPDEAIRDKAEKTQQALRNKF